MKEVGQQIQECEWKSARITITQNALTLHMFYILMIPCFIQNTFGSTIACCACVVVCYNVLTASLFLIQNIPTLGTVAITMALHNCDEVAVAGFGYNLNMPNAPLHYYEGVKMSAIKEVSTLFHQKIRDYYIDKF